MLNRDLSKIRNWEIGGFFWIAIVGTLLHFTYEWSGKSPIVGAFSPVNESVWEHLKLGYFALLFFMFIEYFPLRNYTNSFFLGKLVGIILMNGFIVVFYYSYHGILGEGSLFLDILSFIIGAVLCQYVSYKILQRDISGITNVLSLFLFIFLGLFLVYTTFYPFQYPIFMDSRTGKYGIH